MIGSESTSTRASYLSSAMAIDDEKPSEFIFKAVPKNAKQAAAAVAETRMTQTIKSGLQYYLEQYFNTDGIYRSQLKNTVPYSLQYESRVSAPMDARDPTIMDLQLARLWKEHRVKFPCILLVDQSFEYRISGLGGIGSSTYLNKHFNKCTIPIDATSTILIEIAAMDETTCTDLRDLLVYIFGPLTILNRSHVIYGPRAQDRWEIRLPQAFETQGLERRTISDDAKDSFWTSGIVLGVEFEGLPDIAFENVLQKINVNGSGAENIKTGEASDGTSVYSAGALDISIPETVYLNNPTQIQYDQLPVHSGLVSDNPTILMVDEYGVIRPKRLGKCKIHLMDFKSGTKSSKSWDVKVVPN